MSETEFFYSFKESAPPNLIVKYHPTLSTKRDTVSNSDKLIGKFHKYFPAPIYSSEFGDTKNTNKMGNKNLL